MTASEVFDVIGVGFGPANLALAIAFEEVTPESRIRFLEAAEQTTWQGDMLLDGADIQNHPVRDLVTLRNPRSRYTFMNYLFEEGRLVRHLNLPSHFPLRKEYARYIRWVTNHFPQVVSFGERVVGIEIDGTSDGESYRVTTSKGSVFRARAISFATGRTPYLPPPFAGIEHSRVCHSARYLSCLQGLSAPPRRAAVIGGSQSAVEVTLDLAQRYPDAEIVLFSRAPTLALKDTSPFSEEGYFPDFVDYYHQANRASKSALDLHMRRTNYSCVDGDLLDRLYLLIYEQSLGEEQRVWVKLRHEIEEMWCRQDAVRLRVREVYAGTVESVEVDLVVVATGFRDLGPGAHQEPHPPALKQVIDRFQFDEHGYLIVNRDYSLAATRPCTPPMVLNGLCESTHGIGDAGSFSLLSLRAETILNGLRERGVLQRP